ncbi:MAG: putative phage abortive infection protein [Colwellia sp.]|nr:putative phage abortive infection protein [Colwellia sp.]
MRNSIFWIVGGLFSLFVIVIIYRFELVFYSSLNNWYEMSGIVTAGVTVLLLITTLIIIREAMESNSALKESNEKLENANKEMRDSNIKVLFNATFHPLLSQHNLILNEFRQTSKSIDFDVNVVISNFYIGCFIEDTFKQGTVNDYFRVLYQILNIIKKSELNSNEQKSYSNMLRAFIDNKTLYYVALNASQKLNNEFIYPEYVALIEHFQFLEHLNIKSIIKNGIEHPYLDMTVFIGNFKKNAYGDKVNVTVFIDECIKMIKADSADLFRYMKEIIQNYRAVKNNPLGNINLVNDTSLHSDYLILQNLKKITSETLDEERTYSDFCSIYHAHIAKDLYAEDFNNFNDFEEKYNLHYKGILDSIEAKCLDVRDSLERFKHHREDRKKLRSERKLFLAIQTNHQH